VNGGVLNWAVTHAGMVRPHNEDALVCCPQIGLWAVADGAGGHHAGKLASGMIEAALQDIPPELGADELLTQVRLRLSAVHHALRERARRDIGEDGVIASTVVSLIIKDGFFACLWAGDSRAYLLRAGEMRYITRDHSVVQAMVDAGELTPMEAERHPRANIITRAVGSAEPDLALDKVTDRLMPGDRFLLCTDGLCKALSAETMAALAASLNDPAAQLVSAALRAGARDNVTAVVVEYRPADD